MDFTIVARHSDALLLCEGCDATKRSTDTYKALRQQAAVILQRLTATAFRGRDDEISIGPVDIPTNDPLISGHRFYSSVGGSLIIFSSFEASYPKKLALIFLEEIRRAFVEELKREHGSAAVHDYSGLIGIANTPYQYIRFDRIIERKRVEFRDPRSHESLKKLNASLLEVSSIMEKNITDLMTRGENLEEVAMRAEDLKTKSAAFQSMARRLSANAWLQKYGPFVALGVIAFSFILWVLFF